MKLRDYLAAHAPTEPHPWFEPECPPEPKPDPGWEYCQGCKDGGQCECNADCEDLRKTIELRESWKFEYYKERCLQWPYAWADAVMARGCKCDCD